MTHPGPYALPLGRHRRSDCMRATTMRSGACRRPTTAPCSRSWCSRASSRDYRGSRSSRSGRTSVTPSTASMPQRIARYGAKDIARLMADAGIVRNRLKIEATIDNARALLEAQKRTQPCGLPVGVYRRASADQHASLLQDRAGRDAGVEGHLQGAQGRRLPLRRADHHLCLHAVDRHGQRPPGQLPPLRAVRRAAAALQGAARDRAAHDRGGSSADGAARHGRAPGSACCRAAASTCSIPSPNDIEIEDIAHGLARVARWNGQTLGDHAFSVAQHALLVEEIAAAMQPGPERGAGGSQRCCMMPRNTSSAT